MKSNITELAAIRAVAPDEATVSRLMRLIGGSQTLINADRVVDASRDDLLLAVRALVAVVNESRFGSAQAGLFYRWMPLGQADVRVEIEYEGSEPATRECPGDPGTLQINRVLINGAWIPAYDAVGEAKVAEWEELLDEEARTK